MNEPLPAPTVSGALWRYRLSSLLVVGLVVSVSIAVAFFVGNTAAQGRIVLKSPYSVEALGIEVTSESGFVRYVNQRALFITSDRTLSRAQEQLDTRMTIPELRGAVTTEVAGNGESITITVDVDESARSVAIAEAVIGSYLTISGQQAQQAADKALNTLRKRREELADRLATGEIESDALAAAASQTISELDGRITDVRVAVARFGNGVAFVDQPTVESDLLGSLLRNLAIGMAFGSLLAGTIAWVRADRDRRIHDIDDLARMLAIPVLGEVERVPDRYARLHDPAAVPLGSYQLISSILHNTVGSGVVAVTGSTEGDGATTTVLQVAAAAARAGRRVLVVDAAVRSRELSQHVELDADTHGLVAIANATASPQGCTRAVSVGSGVEIAMIPAGREHRPAGYLRSPLLQQAVTQMRGHYDLVLIDVPPLTSTPEVSSLITCADAVVLAVRKDRPMAAVRNACQRLELLGCSIAGSVLTFARTSTRVTAAERVSSVARKTPETGSPDTGSPASGDPASSVPESTDVFPAPDVPSRSTR